MNKSLKNSNLNGFTTGLVIGGLISAAAVFWFAPQSGKKTQEMIRKRAHQLQLKAERIGQDMQHGAHHASEEIRERVAEVQYEGKEWLDPQSEAVEKSATKPIERVKR